MALTMQRNKSFDVDRSSEVEPLALDISLLTYMSDPETGPVKHEVGFPNFAVSECVSYLPESVVRLIADYILQSAGRQSSLLSLLAMCGVCKHWRAAASNLEPGAHLQFDGTRGSANCTASTLEQRFRILPQAKRSDILRAAARLFRGYTSVTFTGDAIDDEVLLEAAHQTDLDAIVVKSTPNVTDVGLAAAAMQSPRLRSLLIAATSPSDTHGHFLAKLLACQHLESIELKTPMLDLTSQLYVSHRRLAESWPLAPSVTRLALGSPLMHAPSLLPRLPGLRVLDLESSTLAGSACDAGLPDAIAAACTTLPHLTELALQLDAAPVLDACLSPLRALPRLATLTIAVGGFVLDERQCAALGDLPLGDLRLLSHTFRKQALPRPCCSHLDNAGVKAYVDAVCRRASRQASPQPLKLSICGASQLTHDAVSALLRLPVLVKLNISGCSRIAAMDKMRLIAKIKAGREQQLNAAAADSGAEKPGASHGQFRLD